MLQQLSISVHSLPVHQLTWLFMGKHCKRSPMMYVILTCQFTYTLYCYPQQENYNIHTIIMIGFHRKCYYFFIGNVISLFPLVPNTLAKNTAYFVYVN